MKNLNNRLIVKLAGSAGQGIKTAGLILTKALKRNGFKVFGYTEYPSLIRGGHNVFQIEVFEGEGVSLSTETDILLALDSFSIVEHAKEMPSGGVIIYDENTITLNAEQINDFSSRSVSVVGIKLLDEATKAGGNALMKNTVALGALWQILNLSFESISPIISDTYNKTQEMIDTNLRCIKAGMDFVSTKALNFENNIPTFEELKNQMIISGNEAVALGAIASGVRLYSSYPMTPASAILTYLAEYGPKSGMIVKQAEDEINSANMVIGAFHAGTRAMCATSGGGFDLMTEALSLSGITEIPFFCVIGQRPGPATGAPTWTAQSDLDLAIYSGHGEFPRIVVAPADPKQAFTLTSECLNLTERFQTPVLMLLDKHLGESFYTTPVLSSEAITIDRGKILAESPENLTKLRYEFTEDGISPRWFPGDKINTFLANSDEHTEKGYSTEKAEDISKMQAKRLKKLNSIKSILPDPIIYGDPANAQLKIVSWGSNIPTLLYVKEELSKKGIEISILQITYCWPLKKEPIQNFLNGDTKSALIELNGTFQMGRLIKQEIGYEFQNKFNKIDGRPFFTEELMQYISTLVK